MALIALLGARESATDRPVPAHAGALIDFGGQPLVEYQARLALQAGAERILILIDRTAPALVHIVDRLTFERENSAALVQDMPMLARSLSGPDRVLLIGENIVVPPEALTALVEGGDSAILCLPSVPATSAFERIDAQTMWGGALCLPAETVRSTLDMLGDWDLALTLLRHAVQAGARRVMLSPELVMEGRLTPANDQASADLALQALSERGAALQDAPGGAPRGLLAPVTRSLVRELVRRQIEPSRLSVGALLLGALGLLFALGAWMVPALVFALAALLAGELARQCARVTLRPQGSPWFARLVNGGALVVLAMLGWQVAAGQLLAVTGTWLPLFFVGLFTLAGPPPDHANLWAGWSQVGFLGATTLLLLGLLVGLGGPAFALLACWTALAMALRLIPRGSIRV